MIQQTTGMRGRKLRGPKLSCCASVQRCLRPSGSVEDGDRNSGENFFPVFPEMHLREVVGSHQPDEPDAGKPKRQTTNGVGGVILAVVQELLQTGRTHNSRKRNFPRLRQSVRGGGNARLLQGVPWDDKPPDFV